MQNILDLKMLDFDDDVASLEKTGQSCWEISNEANFSRKSTLMELWVYKRVTEIKAFIKKSFVCKSLLRSDLITALFSQAHSYVQLFCTLKRNDNKAEKPFSCVCIMLINSCIIAKKVQHCNKVSVIFVQRHQ